jgi:hypothetical protein
LILLWGSRCSVGCTRKPTCPAPIHLGAGLFVCPLWARLATCRAQKLHPGSLFAPTASGIRRIARSRQFENDRSPGLDHRQGVKRATAGEYSREFSARVFNVQSRLMELGFRQGGSAGYRWRFCAHRPVRSATLKRMISSNGREPAEKLDLRMKGSQFSGPCRDEHDRSRNPTSSAFRPCRARQRPHLGKYLLRGRSTSARRISGA